jgi:hypothetical protein
MHTKSNPVRDKSEIDLWATVIDRFSTNMLKQSVEELELYWSVKLRSEIQICLEANEAMKHLFVC